MSTDDPGPEAALPADTPYDVRFLGPARRAIAETLPETVAAAVLEFCAGPFALNPDRVGKPLFGPLAGCRGARRGTYRIVYRVDASARVVYILDIDHRA
ncbi:MAG: type II toxin-antitoxin system RelE family toxin, partial [Egibacteraceae bacterium]